MLSKTCAIELPSALDAATYDLISPMVARLTARNDGQTRSKSAYQTFGSAWNGVAYRIVASLQYDADFRAAMAAGGSGPAGVERFNQERALFGFATSAVSSIDCFFMAAYAVGAAVPSPAFPLDNAKHLKKYPPAVAKAFTNGFSSDSFTNVAVKVADSTEFQNLKDVRDVLSHRGALLRSHFIGGGRAYAAVAGNPRALAENFQYSTVLNDDTTRRHADWMVATVNELVGALADFVKRQ